MRSFLFTATAMIVAGAAQAGTVEIKNVTNLAALTSVQLSFDGGGSFNNALAGQLEIQRVGGTDTSFNPAGDYFTFCIEPTEFLGNVVMTLTAVRFGDTAVGGMGATKAALVSELYARYQPVLDVVVTNDVGAALQIATWEILRETTATLSMGGGSFRATGPAPVIALADGYLASLTGSPRLFNLNALIAIGNQDLLVQVPSPATLALLGLGMIGLLAARRR